MSVVQIPSQKALSFELRLMAERIGFTPRTCVEVGPAHQHSFRLGEFVDMGCNVILIEANPRLAHCIVEGCNDGDFQSTWPVVPPPPYDYDGLKGYPNVKVINAAITDHPGVVTLYENNASSFVAGINSPACQNRDVVEGGVLRAYQVPAITIDQVDDGKVDILLADVEGSEWFCINRLISRPHIIVLETHGDCYMNPYIREIDGWMEENGYYRASQDETDSTFVRE